jgi:predicted ATP-dependent endonuclease of OLD family
MHIASVHIENYRAISSLDLDFTDSSGSPRPVSVIVGPNGCGKTSILFGIMQALRGVMGFRTTDVPIPTRDDIRLPSSSQSGWSDRPPESLVEVALQMDNEEQAIVREVLQRLHKEEPPKIPEGRITVKWKHPPGYDSGRKRNWWDADVSPHLPYVRSWLKAKSWAINAWKELGLDLVSRVGGFEFFPQDRNLLLRVIGATDWDDGSSDSEDSSSDLEDSGSEFDEEQQSNIAYRRGRHDRVISEILEDLAEYAANRIGTLPDEWNRETIIKELFNVVCRPKQYLGIKYRGTMPYPVLQDGSHIYPLSNAASGEQVILEYITRLVYRGRIQKSVILIDEPEIHLHPK